MKQLTLFESHEKQESIEIPNYQIRACKRCGLCINRNHALTGEGIMDARIMFVALSPGVKEDSQNRMFIGSSGQLFNKLLYASGIDRKLVFMTNLVKCMLPKNRKPTMDEIDSCNQFLNEEISIIQPEVIVPLGSYATRAILTKYYAGPKLTGMSFSNINGKLLSVNNEKVFPLPHPAALLYNPSIEPDTILKYKKLNTII